MSPTQFAEEMRQARLRSPLRTRESALKQFAEVQASLHRQNLLPKLKLIDGTILKAAVPNSITGTQAADVRMED